LAACALGAGALGYVLKEAADEELVEAVRRAAVGEIYLNPRLGARIASEPPPGPPDDLSNREVDVLRSIALGHTNGEIAEQLYLSVRTVETHRSHIQQKTLRSRRGHCDDRLVPLPSGRAARDPRPRRGAKGAEHDMRDRHVLLAELHAGRRRAGAPSNSRSHL
jgi:Bacterial regulatory proteins, luxR family